MVAKKALRGTEDEAFGALFGAFWGPFGYILGVRSALGRECLIKGGVFFSTRRFLLKKCKKKWNLGTRKSEQNRSQNGTEKGNKKSHPQKSHFWQNFRQILGPILGTKMAPKGDQKQDHCWNPSAPHLRGPRVAILRIKRECWNFYRYWNYTPQKKGKDKALIRPQKAL